MNKFGGKFIDVSVLDWGVIFQIHHMMEKIWSWGMITNGLKSPNDLYLDAKSQNMSIYGGYVTLSYSISNYFVFWLILRGDNAVLISLITNKNGYWAIMAANIYIILPPKRIPKALKRKNIFMKWHYFIVKHGQPGRICSLLCQ